MPDSQLEGATMAKTEASEYCTVAQAAQRLQVSPSTIWRWVEAGKLPGYRVGSRSIRIKRQDLEAMIQPAKPGAEGVIMVEGENGQLVPFPRRLSQEEVQRALQLIAEMRASREAMSARRGGKLLDDSAEIIREAREQRSRELLGE
jgi:excisionase family DNA binding protein